MHGKRGRLWARLGPCWWPRRDCFGRGGVRLPRDLVALLKTVAGGLGGLQGLAVFARSGSQRAVLLPCCAWHLPVGGLECGHVSRDLWGGSAFAQPQGGAPTASRGTVTLGAQKSVCLSVRRTGRQALWPWAPWSPRGHGAGVLTAPDLRSRLCTAGAGRGPPSGCPRLGLPPARSLQQQEAGKGRVKEAARKALLRGLGAWGLRPASSALCPQCLEEEVGGLGPVLESPFSQFGTSHGRFTSRTF